MLSRLFKRDRLFSGKIRKDLGSGIYVDVENLQGAAKEIIQSLLESWPPQAPHPTRLSVYVPADKVELWRMWAQEHLPDIHFLPKGVQHFTAGSGKNSADIALVADAVSDFLGDEINFVVVVSNDSDFISLYSKLNERKDKQPDYFQGRAPFLWVLAEGSKNYSREIQEYLLQAYVHFASTSKADGNSPQKEVRDKAGDAGDSSKGISLTSEDLAKVIIQKRPDKQPFGIIVCQKIIKKEFPEHPLARASKVAFERDFLKEVGPSLEGHGVDVTSRNPTQYKMTQEAKNSVR